MAFSSQRAAVALNQLVENVGEKDALRLYRRTCRDMFDPYKISELRFIELFRLPREFAFEMIRGLEPYLPAKLRDTKIDIHLSALMTLNFHARGTYQRENGQNQLHCMSQTMVSRNLKLIDSALEEAYFKKYVSFPQIPEHVQQVKAEFRELCDLPNILGAIDGMLVKISPPKYTDEFPEPCFIDKNRNHSLNVLIATTRDGWITYVNSRSPGSVHDATVYRESRLRMYLMKKFHSGVTDQHLLGDQAYPAEPWLLKIVSGAAAQSKEAKYNVLHKRGRQRAENTICLKRSWQCCLSNRNVLKYSPQRTAQIINVSAILHNMCLRSRILQGRDYYVDDLGRIPPVPQPNYNHNDDYTVEGGQARDEVLDYVEQNLMQ